MATSRTKPAAAAKPEPTNPPTLSIIVDGEPRDLYMSFGLLRELANVAGDLERLNYAMLSPDEMIIFMNVALTKREKNGRPIPTEVEEDDPHNEGQTIKVKRVVPYDANYCDISEDDREALMQWIYGHVLGFFLKRVQGLEESFRKAAPQLQHLNSSASGLKDLIGRMQLPGASEPPQTS